jgi:2-polyprenyl-3-methyl-5-hydroxy-6-metoxy-1,4-benzoquinol methylase
MNEWITLKHIILSLIYALFLFKQVFNAKKIISCSLSKVKRVFVQPLDTRKLVYSLLTPVKNKKILSIGCGEGSECVLFAENGAKVVGIDSSSEFITLARVS